MIRALTSSVSGTAKIAPIRPSTQAQKTTDTKVTTIASWLPAGSAPLASASSQLSPSQKWSITTRNRLYSLLFMTTCALREPVPGNLCADLLEQ